MRAGPDDRTAAGRSPDTGAVIAFGVDNLDVLEELFGSPLADRVMDHVAERLQAVLPMSAVLDRTRNRRILIGLPQCGEGKAGDLVRAAQREIAAETFDKGSGPIALTLSAGSAFADSVTCTDDLTPVALHALFCAMRQGVGSYRVARSDKDLLAYRAQLMETSAATMGAVGSDALTIAFQPVVRAAGTDLISFHECLVRLRQSNGNLLNAGQFMPAIERLGLAPIIDRQVLMMCFETMIRHPGTRLSINVFPSTMQDARWISLFENAADSDPDLAERLVVEITESAALLDLARTRDFMDRLRGYGVAFAMDDFGAGHTSLAHLRNLRFDILKIDRAIVHGIDANPDNRFLLGTLVSIARHFDMMSVAEGVETHREAHCLNSLGIDYFQGFRFGSPSLQLKPTNLPMPEAAAQA